MKKAGLFLLFLFSLGFYVFAQTQETWTSLGFEFGNYFENFQDSRNTYIGSAGISLNFYFFEYGKKVGFFNRNSFLFPVLKTSDSNNFVYGTQMVFVLGPAFRYMFSEKLTLQSGIGINFYGIYIDYTEGSYTYPVSSMVLGLGADFGLKIDVNDIVFLNVGTAFSFNFLNTFSVSSMPSVIENWVDGYMAFEVKPYVCIGINAYTENFRYGKSKK
ncbi:MAG: hypothetical protein LBK61_03610 [Spirochaetaceae bacterium]|jgi:hypothetical protein|nr:hypothetical protein [Spirochaetaceae bacterium]